ncbi:MAG: RNA polymerase sporulation sigma factor SigK [Ruminococcaceae bacterium]|nr:RNA polymerase sporulation sigma factor SigK [Oscillospiraceae bacterium]
MFSSLWLLILSVIRYGPFFIAFVSNNNSSFPKPLSVKDEEMYLLLAQQGDTDAKNKLVEHNLRLVAHITKKYTQAPGADSDDLISIGTVGLIKAINSFDTQKNARLATYAARCIENEILMYMRASKKIQQEISLHECLGHDSDGNEITFIDILTAEDEDVAAKADTNMNIRKLRRYIEETLTDRERKIILMRYGLSGKPFTQRLIAQKMGISRSYVSRIEKKALKKLMHRFASENA